MQSVEISLFMLDKKTVTMETLTTMIPALQIVKMLLLVMAMLGQRMGAQRSVMTEIKTILTTVSIMVLGHFVEMGITGLVKMVMNPVMMATI